MKHKPNHFILREKGKKPRYVKKHRMSVVQKIKLTGAITLIAYSVSVTGLLASTDSLRSSQAQEVMHGEVITSPVHISPNFSDYTRVKEMSLTELSETIDNLEVLK